MLPFNVIVPPLFFLGVSTENCGESVLKGSIALTERAGARRSKR